MTRQIFVGLMSLLFLAQLPQGDSDSEKPLYRPTGQEATLVGTITFVGEIPKPKRIDMTADLICTELSPKGMTEYVVTTACLRVLIKSLRGTRNSASRRSK